MEIKRNILPILLFVFAICFYQPTQACSMYKVSANGKTMVGCNEDAWRTTSRIWFVNAKVKDEYGACFTGSRNVGGLARAPQSGMNEEGLVFSRLVAYHPKENIDQSHKKQIQNEVTYLTNILQQCKNIGEVKEYISQYDHSVFLMDVFIYIDQSGDYLIVEPYNLIEGNDPGYVLANFCPSITNNESARKQERYRNGEDYLKDHGLKTSLEFCRSMSDTMHVCRKRNGDGTLLTSIWDTQNGLVNLYFYHDYNSTIQFNLSKALALGDHSLSIPELFPENPEFQRLANYKTPFNIPPMRIALVLIGGLIGFLSLLYFISYFKKRNNSPYNIIKLTLVVINLLVVVYLFVLATNISIYYFDAPYTHYSSYWISLSSYMPFILLFAYIPLSIYIFRFIKANHKGIGLKSAFVLNNMVYLLLIIGFYYWGLFDVIH